MRKRKLSRAMCLSVDVLWLVIDSLQENVYKVRGLNALSNK